jgi:secreted trypsin-like serine protease
VRRILALLVAAIAASLLMAAPAPAVVGGSDAVTNPGSVSFWTANPYRNRCSGTLIDDGVAPASETEWALTAAHCIYAFTADGGQPVEARIGGTNNSTVGGNYTARTATDFVWHPSFDPNTLVGDIMMVRLNAPVVAPSLKYNFPNPGVGLVGDVFGWGWVCDGPAGQPCSSLYQGPLQRDRSHTLPDSDCLTVLDPAHVCFESMTPETASACRADSGAPFTINVFTAGGWQRMAPIMVLADGDDFSGASCLTSPDGSTGLSLGLEVAPYGQWISDVVDGVTARRAQALPPVTARVLQLLT